MKEYLKVVKELWKNPKTHAIMVLALWLLFIGIVIIVLNFQTSSSSNNTQTTDSTFDKSVSKIDFNNMKSYEFSYNTIDASLNGVYYDGKYLLYLDNNKYYKNNTLYKIGQTISVVEEPGLLKIDSKFIYNLIKDINPITNNEYDSYLVPLVNFIKDFEKTNVVDYNLSSYNIIINVYENKIIIDLTNYYKAKGVNTESYVLTINYYNINNISDFTKEYDLMIGVK